METLELTLEGGSGNSEEGRKRKKGEGSGSGREERGEERKRKNRKKASGTFGWWLEQGLLGTVTRNSLAGPLCTETLLALGKTKFFIVLDYTELYKVLASLRCFLHSAQAEWQQMPPSRAFWGTLPPHSLVKALVSS